MEKELKKELELKLEKEITKLLEQHHKAVALTIARHIHSHSKDLAKKFYKTLKKADHPTSENRPRSSKKVAKVATKKAGVKTDSTPAKNTAARKTRRPRKSKNLLHTSSVGRKTRSTVRKVTRRK